MAQKSLRDASAGKGPDLNLQGLGNAHNMAQHSRFMHVSRAPLRMTIPHFLSISILHQSMQSIVLISSAFNIPMIKHLICNIKCLKINSLNLI